MADQAHNSTNEGMPQLRRHGSATQLIVDGSPFLVIGGELRNSSSSSIEFMQPIWQRMRDLNINTVLTPVSWELIEPSEGSFDFTLVDELLRDARGAALCRQQQRPEVGHEGPRSLLQEAGQVDLQLARVQTRGAASGRTKDKRDFNAKPARRNGSLTQKPANHHLTRMDKD